MGGVLGTSDNGEDVADDDREEDESSENEQESDKNGQPLSDLCVLFDHASLRTAASKLKDDIPESVIQQNLSAIVKWLEERASRNEEFISFAQFCDMLMMRSVSRENCYMAFQQFDREGDGVAEVSSMLESLRNSNDISSFGDLGHVVRTLQGCTLAPGFIDVYSENAYGSGHHGSKMLSYLLRNRAPTTTLAQALAESFPLLSGFNNISEMRLSVLKSIFSKLSEAADLSLEQSLLGTGEELRPITKPYSHIEVSSNHDLARWLTDSDTTNYWQSDGTARSHFIRIKMKPGVVLKQLYIKVSAGDQSYMPYLVVVSVGKNVHGLKEIKECRIPSYTSGDYLLVENLSQFYTYVQICVRRCHNDGCDCRIHGLRVIGYRVVKEAKVSVLDASAVWYLQVLASTVSASLPIAPTLKQNIIEHTKTSLNHIVPLSLSACSGEKPAFLSYHVLSEMDKFLREIALSGDNQLNTDGLYILLGFSLAWGHVENTLSTLKLVQENPTSEFKAGSFLRSLASVRDAFWKKLGGSLQLTLCGCDGGQKTDSPKAEAVLGASWTSNAAPYVTDEGKTRLNMIFKLSEGVVQVTKIKIKVVKGNRGPKCGLIFVYSNSTVASEVFDTENHLKNFEKFDDWSEDKNQNKNLDDPLKPTFFSFDDEWDEAEVFLEGCPSGQFILVKFLQPRDSTSQNLGIVGIKFFGFSGRILPNEHELLEKLVPMPKEETCSSNTVLLHSLSFLVDLAREQASPKKAMSRPQALDMTNIQLQSLWNIYEAVLNKPSAEAKLCRSMCLQLLHCLLPFFDSNKPDSHSMSHKVFDHLCELVDSDPSRQEETINTMARQILIDGAVIFFPDKEARRKKLFNMMSTVNGVDQSPSSALIFQSLCQFFSSVDPASLLNLPQDVTEDFNADITLSVLDTLLSCSFKDLNDVLHTKTTSTEEPSHLLLLLSSLQTSLLLWMKKRLPLLDNEIADNALVKYCVMVCNKATEALKIFMGKICSDSEEEKDGVVKRVETSFLATIVPQFILTLTKLCTDMKFCTRVTLANHLMPLAKELRGISPALPTYFYKVDSGKWKDLVLDDVVLRVWEEESPHNYHNNQHLIKNFTCPGASTFCVEFDTKCETEKRYDYLEFTDGYGKKTRFDQKVGSDKWPKIVYFKGGQRLHFLFHSDSSNNEWGYKFKVTAKGTPDVTLSWMFDLQLSLAKLFGKICGGILSVQKLVPAAPEPGTEDEFRLSMLKSELWTTLFRGGYMVGKLQRSLSGIHETESTSSQVNNFLCDLLSGENEEPMEMLTKCKEHSSKDVIGGDEYNDAVTSLFTALIWHTQVLREELDSYIKSEERTVPDGIYQAYSTADSLRAYLLELKQKRTISEEKEGTKDPLAPNTVESCKEKATFLLKFAGLTKVELRQATKVQKYNKYSKKNQPFSKRSSGDFGKIIKLDTALSEKYPAFRLVMEFVKDPAWSKDKVQHMLQERSKLAQAVSDVYVFASEYVRVMKDEHIFQVPIVLFLEILLEEQVLFPKHYADMLDGCGLELESKVRNSYYTLVRTLVESIKGFNRPTELAALGVASAFDYIQVSMLHLVDVDWQPYDLAFLLDIDLPTLLFSIAKSTVTTRDKSVNEEDDEKAELEEYDLFMKWFDEQGKIRFENWYDTMRHKGDDVHRACLFTAKFCDLLEVEISCDGCGVTLPGTRYRCMQCEDMDLCASCYMGGVQPENGHTDEHEFVHFRYKCDECSAFIAGTRIHCTVCEDFDLCLGCYKKNSFPSGHSADHEVTKFKLVKLKSSNKTTSDLQTYIHQHVWLQFSALTLSLTGLVYCGCTEKEYLSNAIQLLNRCTNLLTECLQQELSKKTDNINEPCLQLSVRQEEAFAEHSQERIMGLLGATIPVEAKVEEGKQVNSFETPEFLILLLKIIRGETGHEVNTQHMAIGLLARLFQRITNEDKIHSIDVTLPPLMSKKDKNKAQEAAELHIAALKYLTQIKDRFADKPEIHQKFVDVMKKYKGGSLDVKSVKSIVSELFEGCADLLKGFDAFLPPGQHLEIDEQDQKDTVKDGDVKDAAESKSSDSLEILEAVVLEEDDIIVDMSKPLEDQQPVTQNVVEFLFSFGASCLERSGLDWACSVANILQDLLNTQGWRDLLLQHIDQSVNRLLHGAELSSIFALFVLAGFPEVMPVGARVKYQRDSSGSELKSAIVLKHFTGKHQADCIVVDCKTRKRVTIDDDLIEVISHDALVLQDKHISTFTSIVKDIISKMKQGTNVGVESLWVLSLCLKALLKSVDFTKESSKELFTTEFVQCLVHVSKQGTGFSKQWLTKDLEILSLMLYSRDSDMVDNIPKSREPIKISGDDDDDFRDPWKDLDDTARMCFQTLHEHLDIPVSVLRAIYDSNGQNTKDLLVVIQGNLEGGRFNPSESIKELARTWESGVKESQEATAADRIIDMGLQDISALPVAVSEVETATEDTCEHQQKLITFQDASTKRGKEKKAASAKLLKKELEVQGKIASKEYLSKVNIAACILYARQLLLSLLAEWPSSSQSITAELLTCSESTKIPCILDMLKSSDNKDVFKKVILNVLHHCEEDDLIHIVNTSCQFLEEVSLINVVKESEHNYKNNTHFEDVVHIPGASYLGIKFDCRCATESNMDELVLATSKDLSQNRRVYSGSASSPNNFKDFEVPGDTLYYSFESDGSNTDWGYMFTVSGGAIGRFDTGYMILNGVLESTSAVSCLPVDKLWRSLVCVASQQVGHQRLKTIQLMLRLLQTELSDETSNSPKFNLTLLAPLWKLYSKLSSANVDKGVILSSAVRAMTELFLMAENLAIKWDIINEYAASQHDSLSIQKLFIQGLENVAALGLMIGMPNKATKEFLVKRKVDAKKK